MCCLCIYRTIRPLYINDRFGFFFLLFLFLVESLAVVIDIASGMDYTGIQYDTPPFPFEPPIEFSSHDPHPLYRSSSDTVNTTNY